MSTPSTRLVVGCMSGTSLDGLDVALTEVKGHRLALRARFLALHSEAFPRDLHARLLAMARGLAVPPVEYLRASRGLGILHADAVAALCRQAGIARPDLVVAHGQTLWHAPDDDAGLGRVSLQLLDPWPIARRLRVPVVYDLRQSDLIAGGQGAPITPMSDWVLYRRPDRAVAVVNLGGICNVTRLPAGGSPDTIGGGDIGPCNLLLDGLLRRLAPGDTCDRDGALALSGTPRDTLWERLAQHPFFTAAGNDRPRSTGRETFDEAFLDDMLSTAMAAGLSTPDTLASACRAVAHVVARGATMQNAISPAEPLDVILAGGGVHNKALLAEIRRLLAGPTVRVRVSDEVGIPVSAREAVGFAVLGALSQDGVPITLPQVTGSRSPGRAGTWVLP